MKRVLPLLFWCCLSSSAVKGVEPSSPLVYEQRFETGEGYSVKGATKVVDIEREGDENGGHGVALDSGDGGGLTKASGAVEMAVKPSGANAGDWYRFSFAGLPERKFTVEGEADLLMQVKFYGKDGQESLDGVVKEIYPMVEADRKDIARNGVGFKNGAEAWPRHAFDFRLPFNDIDTLTLVIRFQNGKGQGNDASFLVDDVRLERIAVPNGVQTRKEDNPSSPEDGELKLLPIGGRWYYHPAGDETTPEEFDSSNLDRLVYKTGKTIETPFAMDRGTWLKKGFKDTRGQIVQEDTWVENAVRVKFTGTTMVIRSANLPNHTTGEFPGYLRNPNFIQEKEMTFTLPLDPQPDREAKAMNDKNRNRALPMGPTGVAVNGVIFYNPFDAGMEDAVNIMDRCCGHPDPGSFYHYHKYPVCARSPFEDGGKTHSPLIGWAFDGFPIYGPYEGKGEMAMDSKSNPLNEFNIHRDEDRGWHYHVSPGRFPYIIGGYWGEVAESNLMKGPPKGGRGGGPGPGGGMRGGPPPQDRR